MGGLKVFLLITIVFLVVYALLSFLFPQMMAEAKMGPQDVPSARYQAAILLGLATAAWYAFRNPAKNVAVIRGLISAWGLSILVGLYNGLTGVETWGTALFSIILGVVLGGGLGVFYPRGEKAT